MKKTYFIKTFGCQANKSDSERIEGDYKARGYRPTNNWRHADEIIVNTCAVRERAEHRARGFIDNVRKQFVIPAEAGNYTNNDIDSPIKSGNDKMPE